MTRPDPAPPEGVPQPRPQRPATAGYDAGTIVRRLGPAGPLALVAATLPAIGGFLLLGLLTSVEPHLSALRMAGLVLYVIAFAVLSGLAVLPTYAQAVLGGWVYRFGLGFPAALAGVLGGALIGYALGQRATGDRLVRLIEEQPKWRAVHQALLGSGFWRTLLIITLVRLNSPFALTNFVLAATRTHLGAYVLGTVLGLGPRTAAAVFIATGLKQLTFEQTGYRWLWIGGMIALALAVIVIGQIASNAVSRVTGEAPTESPKP
jgi:uncharacterized membrane protein YdjX (TVP38/TMEM64 family)